MEKLVEFISKSPVLYYFAAMIAFGILALVSEKQILGILPIWWASFCAALFFGSVVVRSYRPIHEHISYILEKLKWMMKLFKLSSDSRALIALVDEDALENFYYDPRDSAISQLRDQDILQADLISPSGVGWGKFSLTYAYKKAHSRYRPMFRSAVKYSHDASAQVRTIMEKSERANRV
jgi:hypothetical protein